VETIYRALATGRYAAEWLPEFLLQYDQIISEQGEEAALEWALYELAGSIQPALVGRLMRLVRVAYKAWKLYKLLARN
jgi:hypothetical protein